MPKPKGRIYMPRPEGHMPKGAGIYIRQIPSAHVITNICHVTLCEVAIFDEPALISKSIRDLNVGFNNDVFVTFTLIFLKED